MPETISAYGRMLPVLHITVQTFEQNKIKVDEFSLSFGKRCPYLDNQLIFINNLLT